MRSTAEIINANSEALLGGLWVTLKLCGIVWTVGLTLGTALGLASARWQTTVAIPLRTLALLVTSVPVLVLLLWCHFPLQSVLGVTIHPFITAAAVMAVLNTMVVLEIVRAAVLQFPPELAQVARVCGLSKTRLHVSIVLPILFRRTFPAVLGSQVVALQVTLFASLISVDELFRVAQRVNSNLYQPVEVYSALAVFFFVICLPLNALAWWLERRWRRWTLEA